FPAQQRLCTFVTIFSTRGVTSVTDRRFGGLQSTASARCPTPLDALPAARNWAPRKARSHALFAHPGRGACAPGGRSFPAQPRLCTFVPMFSTLSSTNVTDRRSYFHQSTNFARCPRHNNPLPAARYWVPRNARSHPLFA